MASPLVRLLLPILLAAPSALLAQEPKADASYRTRIAADPGAAKLPTTELKKVPEPTPEERAALEKRIQAAVQTNLDALLQRRAERRKRDSTDSVEELVSYLTLSPERKARLVQLLAYAEKLAIREWQDASLPGALEFVRSGSKGENSDKFLKQVEAGSIARTNTDADTKLQVAYAESFGTALKQLLTPDELKLWQERRSAQRERRALALTHMIVAELDREVYLMPAQRQPLEALVSPVAQDVALIPGDFEKLGIYQLNGILGLLEGVGMDKIHAVLDPAQRKLLEGGSASRGGDWSRIKRMIDQLKRNQ